MDDASEPRNLPEPTWVALTNGGFFDYPPRALARLALSYAARDLADDTRHLVPTRYDLFAEHGEFAERAARLVAAADDVLTRAVVLERHRGTSWAVLGETLGITADEAEARFSPACDEWHEALSRPYVMKGRFASSRLPDGVEAPHLAAQSLDRWCLRHLDTPAVARDGKPPVSAHLNDRRHQAIQMGSAVLRDARDAALTTDPIARRTFWERKVRWLELMNDECPGDGGIAASLSDARATLDGMRYDNIGTPRSAR